MIVKKPLATKGFPILGGSNFINYMPMIWDPVAVHPTFERDGLER